MEIQQLVLFLPTIQNLTFAWMNDGVVEQIDSFTPFHPPHTQLDRILIANMKQKAFDINHALNC